MAEAIGLAASIFSLIQATQASMKLVRRFIGPSEHSSEDLKTMHRSLSDFCGVILVFDVQLKQLDDDDDDDNAKLQTLKHLQPVVDNCNESVQFIREFVKSRRTKKFFGGVIFDKKVRNSLKELDRAKEIFKMSATADQFIIMNGVQRYLQNLGETIEEMKDILLSNIQPAQQYREIRAWLNAESEKAANSETLDRKSQEREEGSGDWLLQTSSFQDWMSGSSDSKTLWIKGSPGAGKSSLCSRAINHIKSQGSIVLFHFYRFDNQLPASKVAAVLVSQLLQYWRNDSETVGSIADYCQEEQVTAASMTKTMRKLVQRRKCECEKLRQAGRRDASVPDAIYLLLDGLNECTSFPELRNLAKFVNEIRTELAIELRLWFSAGNTDVLKKIFVNDGPVLDVDENSRADVQHYLEKSFSGLDILQGAEAEAHWIGDQCLLHWALEEILSRSEGNFLFATLMIDQLQHAFTVSDVEEIITCTIPDKYFSEAYKRCFMLYYKKFKREYVMYVNWATKSLFEHIFDFALQLTTSSLAFSLVAFARRPLLLSELYEAMALAWSSPSRKAIDPAHAFKDLERLFPPLIEIRGNKDEPGSQRCVLRHSTVKDFLVMTQFPFEEATLASIQGAPTLKITEDHIADVCLRYLGQDCYSGLIRDPAWDLETGLIGPQGLTWADISRHHFLTYAAKYWDKHLDKVEDPNAWYDRTRDFLDSDNFQTLLQVQSVCVQAQFAPYHVRGMPEELSFRKRVFPRWLPLQGMRYLEDYRRFFTEWSYLLKCGSCNRRRCIFSRYSGEIDICLTGLLGDSTFLGNFHERYPSFSLSQDVGGDTGSVTRTQYLAECVSSDGQQFAMVIPSNSALKGQEPTLQIKIFEFRGQGRPQVVSNSVLTHSHLRSVTESASSVSICKNLGAIRIGSEILRCNDAGLHWMAVNLGASLGPDDLRLTFDDFILFKDMLILFKRARNPTALRKIQKLKKTKAKPAQDTRDKSSSSEEESSAEESLPTSSSEDSASELSAYESCSQGSNEYSSYNEDSAEEEHEEPSEIKNPMEQTASEAEDSSVSASDSASDSSKTSQIERAILTSEQFLGQLYADDRSSDDEIAYYSSDDDDSFVYARPIFPDADKPRQGPGGAFHCSIGVFSLKSSPPARLFHYEQNVPVMLYDSPPIIHPTRPLIVWPISCGDILFADYEENRYFLRQSRATSSFTRHVCMKASFSSCGKYIHIASLEAQDLQKLHGKKRKTSSERGKATETEANRSDERAGSGIQKEIKLAAFVTTYRLSQSKTTRSSPVLVHRAKATIGSFAALSTDKLPATFTWTGDDVYLTVNVHCRLRVIRIALFPRARDDRPSVPLVSVPRESVMLPLSAMNRQVQYIPPIGPARRELGVGLVFMGSQDGKTAVRLRSSDGGCCDGDPSLAMYQSAPMGFWVHEKRDLGGWVPCDSVDTVRNGFRDGQLTRKMERFNVDDDCDVEAF